MNAVFYISSAVAVLATFMVITRANAVRALLYLIVSLLAVAVVFFCLGAPFIAALEVIIYAGAIMVLFVFVIMMLNLGPHTMKQERAWLRPATWIGPAILAAVLLGEVIYVLAVDRGEGVGATAAPFAAVWNEGTAANGAAVAPGKPPLHPLAVEPQKVGAALFGPYVIAVELASMLLLAGLVGACHLGRRLPPIPESEGGKPA